MVMVRVSLQHHILRAVASVIRPEIPILAGNARRGRPAAAASAGAMAHGYLWERHALQVVRTELPVTGLPQELDGLRVGSSRICT